MGRRHTLPAGPLAALLLALPASGAGQVDAIGVLAFMSGSWCSTAGSGSTIIEEHYTTPSANLMLGMTRYLRDGVSVGYEFSRIEADTAGVVLTPMPSGQPAVPFTMTEATQRRAVFENPDHDFPVRIEYERTDHGLLARALGPDGQGQEWHMAACSDSPNVEGVPAVAEAPDDGGSDVFRRLAGSWRGTGTLFDMPATFTMGWHVSEGLATLHFTSALVDVDGNRTPVLGAVAAYRVSGAPEGVWLDTRGERIELRWTVEEEALIVDWRATSEEGRTTYRPRGDGTVEVVDEVAGPEGWRTFGRASHRRVAPAP